MSDNGERDRKRSRKHKSHRQSRSRSRSPRRSSHRRRPSNRERERDDVRVGDYRIERQYEEEYDRHRNSSHREDRKDRSHRSRSPSRRERQDKSTRSDRSRKEARRRSKSPGNRERSSRSPRSNDVSKREESVRKRHRDESIEPESTDINLSTTIIEDADTVKVKTLQEEAARAALDIEEKIRVRREKMLKWKQEKEEKEVVEEVVVPSKTWNLEDEEDDDELLQRPLLIEAEDDFKVIKKEPKPQTPKRTFNFGTSIKKGSQAISFGFKTLVKQNAIVLENRVTFTEDAIIKKKIKNISTNSARNDNILQTEDLDSEDDPLESFMLNVHEQVERTTKQDLVTLSEQEAPKKVDIEDALNAPSDDEIEEIKYEVNHEDIMAEAYAQAKKKEMVTVDHSKIEYESFRKDFYKEPPELSKLTAKELDQRRIDLDGIHVRGAKCPKPVEKWSQFGMPPGINEVIKKILKYDIPSPIQSQAIPAIMSGRDIIGVAKTGSGKTLAFLLPMFRHIKDQRPSGNLEGPISLIMSPTRELALQTLKECKNFLKVLNLRAVCCYGGSPIRDQIAEVKRGTDIIICTPGRMIDLLCANGGRVTNLRRVTFLVLDEADRMFDMGFEPQVIKIIDNIRPDRQTVLFSATFPRFMEALARRILNKPLEILVGSRSVVCNDVTQVVYVVKNVDAKFLRLLGILGKAHSDNPEVKILIFVERQEAADKMLSQLMQRGYPCLSLHGGKDQADRDSVILDFKNGTANILCATSIAARGLDVRDLSIVVNFDCPNHLEDYVHRCGRTGRAGNKGTAYTLIQMDQGKYANDIVKALVQSKVEVPRDLKSLADKFLERVKMGAARISGSGFGGRGLDRLMMARETTKLIQLSTHGPAIQKTDEEKKKDDTGIDQLGLAQPNSSETRSVVKSEPKVVDTSKMATEKAIAAAKDRAAKLNALQPAERSRLMAIELNRQRASMVRVTTDAACWAEIEVNDYKHQARMKVCSKEQIARISGISGCAITTRGVFVPAGRPPASGERKLFLFIEAEQQYMIDRAKLEIKDLLTIATTGSLNGNGNTVGRYNVL